MKLNCWPGCRAIIIKSMAGNEGKIVTCVRLRPAGWDNTFESNGVRWEVDRPLLCTFGTVDALPSVPDAWLRPLPPDHEVKAFDAVKELEKAE